MDNEKLVLNWRGAITKSSEAKLGRELSRDELAYINTLGSFMALEFLENEVDHLEPEELHNYLAAAVQEFVVNER